MSLLRPPALILALDTSTPALSCGVAELREEDGGWRARPLAEALHEPPSRHGDALPAALFEVCARAGIEPAQLDGIAAGVGPGSFTGLRVGLASAKALAYAWKKPLAGGSSLEALLVAAARFLPQRLLVPTTEARRGELYARLVGRGCKYLSEEAAFRAPQLVAALRAAEGQGEPLLFGAGALACKSELLAAGADAAWFEPADLPRAPAAAQVALAAIERFFPLGDVYSAESVFALQPNYLQPSSAEVALAEGRVGGLPKR